MTREDAVRRLLPLLAQARACGGKVVVSPVDLGAVIGDIEVEPATLKLRSARLELDLEMNASHSHVRLDGVDIRNIISAVHVEAVAGELTRAKVTIDVFPGMEKKP